METKEVLEVVSEKTVEEEGIPIWMLPTVEPYEGIDSGTSPYYDPYGDVVGD